MAKQLKNKNSLFNLATEQKLTLLAILVAAIFLGGLVYWRQASFEFSPKPANNQVSTEQQGQYEKLLASIKPNKEASDKLFKQIVNEEEVRKEIETQLDVNQKVVIPEVRDSEIVISQASGKDAVVAYFKAIGPLINELNTQTIPTAQKSFQQEVTVSELGAAAARADVQLVSLKRTETPRELVAFHKAHIITVESYKRILSLAKDYLEGKNSNPWPESYKQYVIANKQATITDSEFQKLDKQYTIGQIALVVSNSRFASIKEFIGIKEAHAVFGLGDTVIVLGNVPDAIKEGVKQGLASSFARFATKYLQNLIGSIEKNYKIGNFLYYSDSLKGQYVNDFLSKYSNEFDALTIQQFIPQIACGLDKNATLKPILEAKAREHLGFEPSLVTPGDPDFDIKMSRVGEFLAAPNGWESYFSDIADQAQGEAEKAVQRELTSSGLKSPRDLIGNQIAASLSVVENSQAAALIASLQLGSVNAENIISQIVAGVISNLVDGFVFQGAVLQESRTRTCIPVPVNNPIIPANANAEITPRG